jgi:hypothetical protein
LAMHEIVARNLRLSLYRRWIEGADKVRLQKILNDLLEKRISPNQAVQALMAL